MDDTKVPEWYTANREILTDQLVTYLNDYNVLNMYVFGSRVYGTATPESDTDIILVVYDWFDSKDVNVHVYTIAQFILLLDRHDIQAMECMSAPDEWVLKYKWAGKPSSLDKQQLRVAVSTIASNSWVKCKKKLTVAGDYDMHLAIKSVFHSLRILDYGIQIASSGRIQTFGSMNYVLSDIVKMSEQYQREELWLKIDDKYRKLYNSKSSEFKLLAPKDLTVRIESKRDDLEKLLAQYDVKSDFLVNEILNLFEK